MKNRADFGFAPSCNPPKTSDEPRISRHQPQGASPGFVTDEETGASALRLITIARHTFPRTSKQWRTFETRYLVEPGHPAAS